MIQFLSGAYKGLTIDLGLAINEIQHSETAEWNPNDGDTVRPKLNFKQLSAREISFSLDFFDLNIDISHLVENLKHLKEITGNDSTPPKLLFQQGDMKAVECVCTSLSDNYSDPLPGKLKGMRHAKVEVKLMLDGGKNDPNALGGPLTSTPLADKLREMTEAERQRLGRRALITTLMAPCLGDKGSEALQELLEKSQQTDVSAVLQLDPNTLVQSAIAGIFSKETLGDPRVADRLRRDLALVLAQAEPGVGNTPLARKYADRILDGGLGGLSGDFQDQVVGAREDFQQILTSISTQALDDDAEIFNREEQNRTAAERLFRFGSCGLDLRRTGAANLKPMTEEDRKVLDAVNQFLASKPTDDQIKGKFGLKTESQIRALKNAGGSFQSKEQFVEHVSQNNIGITGYVVWSNFAKNDKQDN